jgi:transforming growth factor-beta-induced protein
MHMKIQNSLIFALLVAGLTSCPQPAQPKTVYDIIATDSRLSSLKASLTPAQIAFLSDTNRSLTVFAPQNAAFDAAAFAGMTSPKPSGKSLENTLNFAILPTSLDAAALKKTIDATTKTGTVINSLGDEVYVFNEDSKLYIDSGYYDSGFLDTYAATIPEIVGADIKGSNGVVHIIDKMLLNATIAETTFAMIAKAGESAFNTQLSNLNAFTTLRANGAFTVFLPEDPDFEALPAAQRNCLATNSAVLQRVLNHNIVDGQFLKADLASKAGTSLPTKNGDSLSITTNASGTVFLDGIAVKANDPDGTRWGNWVVRNGVTQITDGLLVPANVNLTACTAN